MSDWDNIDFNSIPLETRAKMQVAWQGTPNSDPYSALGIGGDDIDSEEPLTRAQALDFFNKAQRKLNNDHELNKLRTELGEDFGKYHEAAKPNIDKGISPYDAFKLARHDDVVAATAEKARTDALSGIKAEARNGEQPLRGSGSNTTTATEASGNAYIDDPELYKSKRTELLKKVDYVEAVKFRVDNPEFVEAEKHNGDLKAVSRR